MQVLGALALALTALHALGFVNMGHMVMVERNSTASAHIFAAVSQTAAAGGADGANE